MIFSAFGTVHYVLMVVGFLYRDDLDPEKIVIFLGLAQMVNSVGVILRSPVLLAMQSMREAFLRGLPRFG